MNNVRLLPLRIYNELKPFFEERVVEVYSAYDRKGNEIPNTFQLREPIDYSKFFYEVKMENERYFVVAKPKNYNLVHEEKREFDHIDSLLGDIKTWIAFIALYKETEFDQRALDFYEKEFSADFKFKDVEEENSFYKVSDQIRLVAVLDRVEEIVKEEKNEKNKHQIKEIISDLEELKEKLPVSTKGTFVKGLHRLMGKIYIAGAKILKKVIVDKGAELLGQFVGGVIKVLTQG